jgi:hypothetical protein
MSTRIKAVLVSVVVRGAVRELLWPEQPQVVLLKGAIAFDDRRTDGGVPLAEVLHR